MDQSNPEYKLFESIFRQHFQPLARYAFTILKNEADSEDVVQEVFIRIWNNNREVLRHDQPKFYLITAVKNGCISFLRKQATKTIVSADNLSESNLTEKNEETGSADLIRLANKALVQLPPQCLAIFKMSRFGKLTYQQIADELGLSVKTVENQMGKALRLMREFAKKNEVTFLWILAVLINILKNLPNGIGV